MYWCKKTSPAARGFLILLVVAITACRPQVKETKGQFKYFDLAGFTRKEEARLNKSNPDVYKTVIHNQQTESKTLKIANWAYELDLFASSDINKPSWRDSYSATVKEDTTICTALTPDLKTRRISVVKKNGKVLMIDIVNHTKNLLYETTENLTWYPDSLYHIDKLQHVVFLGAHHYVITAKIGK